MANQVIEFLHEEEPPRFLRAQALPYPELKRVWVRAELTPFAAHPALEMTILDPDGRPEVGMAMLDVQHTYLSLTMHLKQPRPGAAYRLWLQLSRDGLILDQREVPFDLIFVDRDQAKADSETLTWAQRGVPISPLPPEG